MRVATPVLRILPHGRRVTAAIGTLCLSFACTAEQANNPRIHRVAGGADEVFANAYIIEGESGLVVVDALLTRSGSRALRRRVDALGKPLLAVLVTHGHPDHYGGVTQLVAGLDATPVVALTGVDRVIRRDDALKGQRLKALGIDWAERRTFPNVIVNGAVELTFGDISLESMDLGPAESDHDSGWVLHVGNTEHVFVGDLVMNGVHAFTADANTGPWIEALARLDERLTRDARLYPGHGEPGPRELLGTQIDYLTKFRAEVQALAAGRPFLSADQIRELETRMVHFVGHDRMVRWIHEGATPIAEELSVQVHRQEP